MSSTTYAPYQSSPLASKPDPRIPSPSTPRHTARLWDEFERRAIENAKRREKTCGKSASNGRSQRLSNGPVVDIIKSYDTTISNPPTPQFDFNFPTAPHRSSLTAISPTTVAICKTCKQPINSTSGVCEQCMKTIVLAPTSVESTPLLNPSCRNFASTDLAKLQKQSTSGRSTPTPSSTPCSPKSRPRQPSIVSTLELPLEHPARLSSLRPQPYHSETPRQSFDTARTATATASRSHSYSYSYSQPQSRKSSLVESNGLHPSRQTRPSHRHHPSTPTAQNQHQHQYISKAKYSRHLSATPSELSTLYPYIVNATPPATAPGTGTVTPQSMHRASTASYSLHNTISAWDDWDSDGEGGDKAGLVGYWRGKKWRGSRGSVSAEAREKEKESGKSDSGRKKKEKRRGFVRVISCGCSDD